MSTPAGIAIALVAASGCATDYSEKLPLFAPMPPAAAARAIADRSTLVRTMSSAATVTLTRPDGESVTFDAAVVMQPPDRARLRAWKFGQAVFDLTVLPDGVWLVAPEDPSRKEKITAASAGASKLTRSWALLAGGSFFAGSAPSAQQISAEVIRFTRPGTGDETTIACDVDAATLTPRLYVLHDRDRVERFRLTLDRYRAFEVLAETATASPSAATAPTSAPATSTIVWPLRVVAISEQGTVQIELRDVEFNADLAPAALRPPRRAEKLP